jgi:hypothetical protein
MAKQAHDYRNTAKTTVKDTERLAGELSDIRITEAQALGNDPPAGYIANNGHLSYFLIPDSAGVYAVACYVRSPTTDPTTAFETMGETCDPIYATTIQATPSKSICSKLSRLPAWFLGILNGPESGFRLLEKEARRQCDWGLLADIRRTCTKVEEADDIHERIYHLKVELEGVQREATLAQGCLEEAFAPKRLQWLEGLCTHGAEPLFATSSARVPKPEDKHGRGCPSA